MANKNKNGKSVKAPKTVKAPKAPKTVKPAKTKSGKGPGAPKKPITWPTEEKFTLKDAYVLNPKVCLLTVRQRAAKELKEVGAKLSGKAGAPEKVYSLRANIARRLATVTVPVTTVETLPVPVNADENQTANAEVPAQTPVNETQSTPVEQVPVVEAPTPEAVAIGGELQTA